MTTKKDKKTGPVPERVKINGDWEDAMSDAMKKKRPEEGWPDDKKKEKKDD